MMKRLYRCKQFFLRENIKAQAIKGAKKINKLPFLHIKTIYASKDTVKKLQNNIQNERKDVGSTDLMNDRYPKHRKDLSMQSQITNNPI